MALKRSLGALPGSGNAAGRRAAVRGTGERIDPVDEARVLIGAAITPEPPPTLRRAALSSDGSMPNWTSCAPSSATARDWIAGFEAQESERTGIPSLKVGYNQVFGYYIEVTNAHLRARPARLRPQADADERRALHHARS